MCRVGDKHAPEHLLAVLDKKKPHSSLKAVFTGLDHKVWLFSRGVNDVDVSGA